MAGRCFLKIVVGLIPLTACQLEPQPAGEQNSTVAAPVPTRGESPLLDPAMDRAALLLAAADAASSTALGLDDREAQRLLDGKRFAVRMRFGCPADADRAIDDTRRWRLDEASRRLRFSVATDIANDPGILRAIGDTEVEAVEGFWFRRPWLRVAGCPLIPAPAPAPTPARPDQPMEVDRGRNASEPSISGPRIGIAQFFTEADARTRRRDSRPYQTTTALEDGEMQSGKGYDLILSGRLDRLANGRVVTCTMTNDDAPLTCVVAAEFDRVAIEHPDTGATIAEWSGG